MILLLLLLAAAAPEHVPVIEETVVVPSRDWRAIDLTLQQRLAVVECNFTVARARAGVRIALMRRDELEALEAGQRQHFLAVTGFARSGTLRYRPLELGEYALVVDNGEGRGPAEVKLDVWLDFGALPVRTLSTRRRLLIIVLTLLVFSGLVLYAGRRLQRAVRSRS